MLVTVLLLTLATTALANGKYGTDDDDYLPKNPVPVWNCTAPAAKPLPSNNVRRLKPGNIKVVMALGDSISAGFAMHAGHALDVFTFLEYRGDVFSIGGNNGNYTFPNFLQTYAPDIVGASIGNSLPLDYLKIFNHAIQPFDPRVTHLNAAQSGAVVSDCPAQVSYIEQQLKTTYALQVDYELDWKVMTIFIGANNLCSACRNSSSSNPDNYINELDAVLAQINSTIPRTFVNVMLLFNISQVWNIHQQTDYCKFMWEFVVTTECGCLTDHSTPQDRETMDLYTIQYNERITALAEKWNSYNYDGFYVAVQPFLQNQIVDSVNYVSKLDCFHPSPIANAAFAIGLWNSMMLPADQKPHAVDPDNLYFICPDDNTFLQ